MGEGGNQGTGGVIRLSIFLGHIRAEDLGRCWT